jgi:hypothetical protein
MVWFVPDAGSYAPVTFLIDERHEWGPSHWVPSVPGARLSVSERVYAKMSALSKSPWTTPSPKTSPAPRSNYSSVSHMERHAASTAMQRSSSRAPQYCRNSGREIHIDSLPTERKVFRPVLNIRVDLLDFPNLIWIDNLPDRDAFFVIVKGSYF